MKASKAESSSQRAGDAARSRSTRRPPVTKRLDRLETMSEDVQERLMTLEKRVTAMQAQLDHLKAR
jgi:prefoldin subunit 5